MKKLLPSNTTYPKAQRLEPTTPEFLLLKEIRSKLVTISSKEQDAEIAATWDEALSYIDRLIRDRMMRWG